MIAGAGAGAGAAVAAVAVHAGRGLLDAELEASARIHARTPGSLDRLHALGVLGATLIGPWLVLVLLAWEPWSSG